MGSCDSRPPPGVLADRRDDLFFGDPQLTGPGPINGKHHIQDKQRGGYGLPARVGHLDLARSATVALTAAVALKP
jgi:hypothetical protein